MRILNVSRAYRIRKTFTIVLLIGDSPPTLFWGQEEIGNKYFWLLQIIPIIFFLYRHFYWNMDQTDKT